MKKLFIILAMFATLLMPISIAAPANAGQPGCSSDVQDRAETWSERTVFVSYEGPEPMIPHVREIILTGTVIYYFCPNGNKVNQIKPRDISWCYTLPEGSGVLFDGVKFNAYFFDDNTEVNPPQVKVSDGGVQNCRNQAIANTEQKWLRMPQSPGWKISSWIVLHIGPDDHVQFTAGSAPVRFLHPDEAVDITGWYRTAS